MKRFILAATALTIALSGSAQAEPPGKVYDHRGKAAQFAPGQVKKHKIHRQAPKPVVRRFAPGQRMPRGFHAITNYRHYGMPDPGRGFRYVGYDGFVYKISTETAMVVALIGLLSDLR